MFARFLQRHAPALNITTVDIDDAIVDVAKRCFGLRESDTLRVVVSDGVAFVAQQRQSGVLYDVVVIDVDSKDVSVGMSCPPAVFVSDDYLAELRAVLRPFGVLLINVRRVSVLCALIEFSRSHYMALARFLHATTNCARRPSHAFARTSRPWRRSQWTRT